MQKTSKIAILFSFLSFFGMAQKAMASCTVSVSPNNVVMGVSSVSHFNVSNGGEAMGNWVRIQSPGLSAYTVAKMEAAGWYPNGGGTEANFAGGYLEGGTSSEFDLTLAETGEVISSMSWEALLSYDDGANFESCGSTTLQVIPAPAAPTISGVSLTVGNSSAVLTWNSNLTATGVVNYGITSAYGSSVVTASGTTHTAGITGLAASTLYHYQIQVVSEGGTTSSTDATFTTSAADVTTTTTTTVTNTVTTTNTTINTVDKTVILADTSKPTVMIATKLAKTYTEPPIVEGKVVDTGAVNVGVVKIQYSTDGGHSWLLVEEPNGANKVNYSFVPEVYDDGNYPILVRATDKSGNVGVSSAQTLIIDRLPPRIIHSLWRVGPIILTAPYQIVAGVPVQVTLQAVGGVTEMELMIGEQKFNLIKNFETGLWEGEVRSEKGEVRSEKGEGEREKVVVRARDGGGNEIKEEMGEIELNHYTNVSLDQSQSVYRFDELTKRFKVWNGAVYGQENPSIGKSSWYLPVGKYYIEGKGRGYKTAQTEIFELDNSGVVSIEGQLEKWQWNNWWKRGNIKIKQTNELTNQQTNELTGKQIAWLDKTEWRGKEISLTVMPMWDPRMAEIVASLPEDSVVVIPGANESSVDLLKNRGSYVMSMLADPDGEILGDLKGVSLPVTLRVNRRGQVE